MNYFIPTPRKYLTKAPIFSFINISVHPVSPSGINLTLRWSLTNGSSWEGNALQIWPGPSGYSSMTSLDSGSAEDRKYVFVIYEKGHKDYFETVSFAKIHLYGGR